MTPETEPTVSVATDVAAPPEQVYGMVSDVTRMGEWSPECVAGEWLRGADGPALGARFRGRNRKAWRRWSTTSEIVEADPGRAFAFRTRAVGLTVATWRYRFTSGGAGCTVTEEWTDERGGTIKAIGTLVTGVSDRSAHNRAGMEATLAALKAAAEQG